MKGSELHHHSCRPGASNIAITSSFEPHSRSKNVISYSIQICCKGANTVIANANPNPRFGDRNRTRNSSNSYSETSASQLERESVTAISFPGNLFTEFLPSLPPRMKTVYIESPKPRPVIRSYLFKKRIRESTVSVRGFGQDLEFLDLQVSTFLPAPKPSRSIRAYIFFYLS